MPQVTMKQAVAAAKDAIKNLYEDSPLKALALEELELVNDSGKERRAVTLGFYRPKSVPKGDAVNFTHMREAAGIL